MTIIQDIRSAARTLRRSPAFAAPIVLSPAFAIGGNVAAFSLVNTFFLRPLSSPNGIRCTRRPTGGRRASLTGRMTRGTTGCANAPAQSTDRFWHFRTRRRRSSVGRSKCSAAFTDFACP